MEFNFYAKSPMQISYAYLYDANRIFDTLWLAIKEGGRHKFVNNNKP